MKDDGNPLPDHYRGWGLDKGTVRFNEIVEKQKLYSIDNITIAVEQVYNTRLKKKQIIVLGRVNMTLDDGRIGYVKIQTDEGRERITKVLEADDDLEGKIEFLKGTRRTRFGQ